MVQRYGMEMLQWLQKKTEPRIRGREWTFKWISKYTNSYYVAMNTWASSNQYHDGFCFVEIGHTLTWILLNIVVGKCPVLWEILILHSSRTLHWLRLKFSIARFFSVQLNAVLVMLKLTKLCSHTYQQTNSRFLYFLANRNFVA